MDPIDTFAAIQPLITNEVQRILDAEKNQQQYNVVQIPNHTHNGIDTVQLDFSETFNDSDQLIVLRRLKVTSAQILALKTTPLTIVPAQGSNTLIVVEGITAFARYLGTAYTGTHNLEFRYTDGTGDKVTADMDVSFLNTAANAYYHVNGAVALTGVAAMNGKPIVMCVATADPAAGNGVITLLIKYRLVPFV